MLGPAEIAVARADLDVLVVVFGERPSSAFGQFRHDFDREYLVHQLGEHGRLISRAGSDLQHGVIRMHVERFCHVRHDERLGDRLLIANRKRLVVVRAVSNVRRDEKMTRHPKHRIQDRSVLDAARFDLRFDHRGPRSLPRVPLVGLRT